MPTYKHACPYCGKFIDKIAAACPYCGAVEPFSPKRCQACRKIVEDPAWKVCPSCGASLVPAPPPAAGAKGAPQQPAPPAAQPSATPAAPAPAAAPAPVPAAPAGKCSGCGAPLPSGARFCTICGTMAG
jgi:RNA polymerase subunit RPABC4/transcription elongation factor Spt4